MKECRHGIEADACELCQEHIRAVAARLGARGGMARKLALSQERREEIARIAAQRRWAGIMKEVAIRPYRPHTPEHRAKIIAAARGRWAGVKTKRKEIERALTENPSWDREALAAHVGCSPAHVYWVGTQMGIYTPMSRAERIERIRERWRLKRQRTEITQQTLADPKKLVLARRIRALIHRDYKPPRIAQLLDLPEVEVRAYIKALREDNIALPKAKTLVRMTPEDVENAYVLWKEGRSYRSIAAKIGRSEKQIEKALLKFLRAKGEK